MGDLESRDIVIVGAGGLGREVLWMLGEQNAAVHDVNGRAWHPRILGFIDDDIERHDRQVSGFSVLGRSDWLNDHPEVLVVVAVGIPAVRRRVVEILRQKDVQFGSCVSSRAIVGAGSHVGEGSIVLPGAVVTVDVQLGSFALLNPTTSVSHDCIVGDFTSLGPGVSLAGNVRIGSACDIGTNASAIPGVTVGDSTIVGAGACVVRDLPDNVTAVGVPAKVVG